MVLAQGELYVKVVEARGLIVPSIPGFFGILCPYVILIVKDQERRTRMIENTKDPVFGEQFVFDCRLDESDVLDVKIYNHREKDSSQMGGHPLIGGLTVPLADAVASNGALRKLQYTVVDDLGQPKGKVVLEVGWEEKGDLLDRLALDRLLGQRPWYLRAGEYYALAKRCGAAAAALPGARALAPAASALAEGALARGAALAGLKVATEVPLEEASAAAEAEVQEAAELAMLTLLDTKLQELFSYLDTKVDAAKDGLAAGAKRRKNRAKFLAVDTARAAADRARDKTRQTTQYVSKNINHTKSFVGSKYTGTKDSLFSGAVYLQDKKNAAVTSSVERVKAVAFVLYEAVEPFAVRFPIINKYFRQAEEVAEAAAEFYDDVQEALSEEDGGGGAPAAATDAAPEEETASPEHSFVRNSPTGATPKHDTAETSINKVPTPRLTYQNSVPKTKEFERPDSVPPTAAAAVEPEAARPEEGSPENADGTDPAPKPPSPMAELMGRISPRRQRPSSSGQALPSNN